MVPKYKNNSSRGRHPDNSVIRYGAAARGKMLLGSSQNSIMIVRRNQSFPSNLESHWRSWSVKARGAKRPAHHFFSSNPFFDSCWFSFFFLSESLKSQAWEEEEEEKEKEEEVQAFSVMLYTFWLNSWVTFRGPTFTERVGILAPPCQSHMLHVQHFVSCYFK